MVTQKKFLWIILSTQAVCVSEVFAQGVATCGAAPNSLNFGSVTVDITSSQTFNVSNTGIAPVTILQATVMGAGFGVSGPSVPLILAAGQSATFDSTFTPTVSGSVTGSISISSTATNSPTTVSLSGTGVTLLLNGSPTSTNFGNVVLGDHGAVVVTLTNTGTGNVTISQANVMGREFNMSGLPVPLTLAPGQSTGFSLTFAPNASGPINGNVSIVSSATNSPFIASFSGAGIHAVALYWQASSSTVAGYNVYRGSVAGGPYTRINSALVNRTGYVDISVQSGQGYYYVVTAADANNNESAYSNEGFGLVPSS